MVLDRLSESLKNTLKRIAQAVFVNEKLVDDLVKDIQRALLSSDVNVKQVFELTKNIKERALKEKPPSTITAREHLIKIVYEELVKFLGEEKSEIQITKKKPFKIMFLGLFGSGKTTTLGKVAKYYAKRGYKIAALGLDVYRPAAPEQLKQVCDKINIPSFIDKKEKDPLKIYRNFEKEFSKYDILLIDTAGRDALSRDLIEELEKLNKELQPDERLLILSADIGQAAKNQAESFHNACKITGVIITKLDGTAKGGGALTACVETKAPVKFIGLGEKVDDLETFNPKGFVSRLLGMGDLEALLEKTQGAITEEKAREVGKKLLKGEFNFLDLYEQLQAMKKLGPIQKVMELIPGFSNMKIPKEMLDVQEGKLEKWKFILDSMTKEELGNPDLLDTKRIDRISKGSGTSSSEVRELLKQYRQSQKLMKTLKGKSPEKLLKKFQGKMQL